MRDTCIDACCLINLANCGAIEVIVDSRKRKLACQGLVEDEVREGDGGIEALFRSGLVRTLSGDLLNASEVQKIIEQYNLGVGESECIAIGKKLSWCVASDDKRARDAARKELGEGRVTGSLGLLRESVSVGLLSRDGAYRFYAEMRRHGAFLPHVSEDFFDT
jgi:predicted nucleic acid-binding protein